MALMISYILSITATVLGIIEPFGKKMSTVLAFNFTGNLIVGISYLLAGGDGALAGAAICFVACIQVFINYSYTRHEKRIPNFLLAVYLVVFIAVNLVVFKAWYDILALAAAVCYVFSISQQKPATYRILYCLNSTLWIVYDFMAGAYGNLSTHIALAVFTLVSMFVNDRKNKKEI